MATSFEADLEVAGCTDAEVCGQQEHGAHGERVAVARDHHRGRVTRNVYRELGASRDEPARRIGTSISQDAEIEARREATRAPGEKDGGGLLLGPSKAVVKRVDDRRIERVRLSVIDPHSCNVSGELVLNGVTHGATLAAREIR